MTRSVFVSGATGFVGSACWRRLSAHGWPVVAQTRQHAASANSPSVRSLKDGAQPVTWLWESDLSAAAVNRALQSTAVVIHTAARVHQVHETAADPLAEYRRVNRDMTLQLARHAAQAGVRRFVFLSTIKVNGDFSLPGQPFRADDTLVPPSDPYGLSKYEAEMGLREIAAQTGLEVVIIRPPLVYGPGVKANFLSMMRAINRGWPLPLGAIGNQRSLVALNNLVDLMVTCVDHPAAANQTFLVSDQQDVSTSELLRMTGAALGKPARLVPVPQGLLKTGLSLIGKGAAAQRLCADLAVDSRETTRILGWKPPVSMEEALRATAQHFLASEALR
jgi:nucleoside-diphosphate-sugar epimerase